MALTQVKTLGIADDAVTLAKQAAGTDGQIITYDASGNPTAVGPGTDGQVLTSTGAGSPPAFEAIPGGATGVDFNDDVKIRSGTGNDLEIYFDGSLGWIDSVNNDPLRVSAGTGNLYLQGDNVRIGSESQGEYSGKFIKDGAVELYYDNVKKLSTDAHGVQINDWRLQINAAAEGEAAELYFYSDQGDDSGDCWRFSAQDGGVFYLQGYPTSGLETFIKATGNGAVELYYDNSKRLETKSDGIKITGLSVDIDADSAAPAIFSGDSNRTGAAQHLAEYRGDWNGTTVARMVIATGDDTTNKDEGMISLQTHPGAGGSMTERVKVTYDGHVWTNKTKEMFWYKSPTNASTNSAVDSNGILIFGSAIQSNSGVYNTSNGRFTAPITGVYFFFFNGLIDNNAADESKLANLYKNGSNMNTIAYTYYEGSEYMMLSGCGLLNLVKDDYVQIYAIRGMHTAGETNFGGYFVG
tara:strand:- start:542 stop:1942 length:1401 start_codon:yes stop_codon:yes gene_type:complete